MKKNNLSIPISTVLVLLLGADLLLAPKRDAAFLLALLFWSGIVQGMVALCAAAELSGGKWMDSFRPYVRQYYPVLLLFPPALITLDRHTAIYSWSLHPTAWLEPQFFMFRNLVVMTLPFIFAHLYFKDRDGQTGKKGLFAVLYLLGFVTSQSFMAFDLVMTLEYPWINTLFGGYFLVEALYAGIAFSALLSALLGGKDRAAFKDFVNMLMGFALLWVGLFFSQYLVIWYGNIPEEVSFIEKRLSIPSLGYMGIYILLSLFLIPFVALISKKVKAAKGAVIAIALVVLSGLLVERLLFLLPTAPVDFLAATVHIILMGLPLLYLFIVQYRSQKAETSKNQPANS